MKLRFLTGLIPLVFLAGCAQTEPVSHEVLVTIRHYYVQHPVGVLAPNARSWTFSGASNRDGQVLVFFLIPRPFKASRSEKTEVLSQICPGKNDKIWRLLPPKNKLVVQVWTSDHSFNDSVGDCKSVRT